MEVPPLLGGRLAGRDFVLVEWVDDGESSAERPIAPLHVHDADDEAWYVLDGRLALRRGAEVLELPAGSGAIVPRGVAHTYWNAGPSRARYLLVLTPRIAALIDAVHEPGASLPDVFARFASRLCA